jgi:hypothetical protein
MSAPHQAKVELSAQPKPDDERLGSKYTPQDEPRDQAAIDGDCRRREVIGGFKRWFRRKRRPGPEILTSDEAIQAAKAFARKVDDERLRIS